MVEALLRCVGVRRAYGGVVAVDEVSLEVNTGEIVGLIGPNGAGKTTLVDVIGGEQRLDSGAIYLAGEVLVGDPARRSQRGIGRTFQHPQLATELTVEENIMVGFSSRDMPTVRGLLSAFFRGIRQGQGPHRDVVLETTERLNLKGLERPVSQLSIGEFRLVEVARALVQDPMILMLDEPFAGMDSIGLQGVREALDNVLTTGCGVIVVDHNIDIVAPLVHRIVLMERGSVAFDGDPQECLKSSEMQRVYFGVEEDDE